VNRTLRALGVVLMFVSLRVLAVDITVLPNEELQKRYEALTHELR